MDIIFRDDITPVTEMIMDLYNNSDLLVPMHEVALIKTMFENADIIITAWESNSLIGISRALTDYCSCCYLANLSVRRGSQEKMVGKKLIELTRDAAGNQPMVLLISVPDAVEYYPKIGFLEVENSFVAYRTA